MEITRKHGNMLAGGMAGGAVALGGFTAFARVAEKALTPGSPKWGASLYATAAMTGAVAGGLVGGASSLNPWAGVGTLVGVTAVGAGAGYFAKSGGVGGAIAGAMALGVPALAGFWAARAAKGL